MEKRNRRNKAVFLDRDGTLNKDLGEIYRTEDLEILEGVTEGLSLLKDYKLFIVTNQSGIGRGYYIEEDMHKFNNQMVKEFEKDGTHIEKIYFCPHKPEDNCECRKPLPKLVKEAGKEFDIDLENSYVIGDKPADISLAKNSGCRGIYLLTGWGVKCLDEARKIKPDYIAANFKQATDYIILDRQDKILKRKEIRGFVNNLKKENKKIVTINGAFDILHSGHEKILKEAKKQGDILIVGLNSDSSVEKNKGPNRPINTDSNRAKMLASFDFIDYVTIFDEKTPIELLEEIRPDVHVNGSEYGKECIEARTVGKNGGKIYLVELLEGFSTSEMIKR